MTDTLPSYADLHPHLVQGQDPSQDHQSVISEGEDLALIHRHPVILEIVEQGHL